MQIDYSSEFERREAAAFVQLPYEDFMALPRRAKAAAIAHYQTRKKLEAATRIAAEKK